MPSPQKIKGSTWERDVAKFLTTMYGEQFIRTPGSGAYIGGTNTQRKATLHEGQIQTFKGDISPGPSFPRLNIECKSYKEFPFHQLFTGSIKQLDGWIEQLLDVADQGDFNILLMKFNRKGTYILFQPNTTLKPLNSFTYTSEKFGTWIFMDYKLFWDNNSDAVKALCSK